MLQLLLLLHYYAIICSSAYDSLLWENRCLWDVTVETLETHIELTIIYWRHRSVVAPSLIQIVILTHSLHIELLAVGQERGEHQVWHLYSFPTDGRLLDGDFLSKIRQLFLVVLSLLEGDTKQLVLALGSFDLSAHLFRHNAKVLALVLQVRDRLIVLFLNLHQVLEFRLVPLQLVLKVDDSGILREL